MATITEHTLVSVRIRDEGRDGLGEAAISRIAASKRRHGICLLRASLDTLIW
jgi:hypothetical protein